MNTIKSVLAVVLIDTQTVPISRIPHLLMLPKVQAIFNDVPNIARRYRETEVLKMVRSTTTVYHRSTHSHF